MVFNKNLWLRSKNGIRASELALGTSVFLMENNSPTEYMVVHHGCPSELYDESCNGLWLLRKDIYKSGNWDDAANNSYSASATHTYLNNDFFNTFGDAERNVIKQVKIPYIKGNGTSTVIGSGTNGLSTKVFLLSAYEVGLTSELSPYIKEDGSKLDFFESGDTANGANRQLRIAYLSGKASPWWTRSAKGESTNYCWHISTDGGWGTRTPTVDTGIRPSLILPLTVRFDEDTLTLIGGDIQ